MDKLCNAPKYRVKFPENVFNPRCVQDLHWATLSHRLGGCFGLSPHDPLPRECIQPKVCAGSSSPHHPSSGWSLLCAKNNRYTQTPPPLQGPGLAEGVPSLQRSSRLCSGAADQLEPKGVGGSVNTKLGLAQLPALQWCC